MKHLFFLLIWIGFLGCNAKKQSNDPDKEKLSDEIRQTFNNYYQDISKHGLTAEFKYLDSSADFFWVPPGYSFAINYDSVAAAIKRNAVNLISVNNSIDSLHIVVLNDSLALFTARTKSVIVDTAQKTSSFFLLETGVMRKSNGQWKLLSGQTAVSD